MNNIKKILPIIFIIISITNIVLLIINIVAYYSMPHISLNSHDNYGELIIASIIIISIIQLIILFFSMFYLKKYSSQNEKKNIWQLILIILLLGITFAIPAKTSNEYSNFKRRRLSSFSYGKTYWIYKYIWH